jgi:hypothetical protein
MVLSDSGTEMAGDIDYPASTEDVLVLRFGMAVSGKAVVAL